MKRRSNGEGSFRKLPSGNWSGQIMVGYTPEGKRKIKTFTAPTKPEAREKIRQYLDSLSKKPEITSTISFSEWADTWYADMRTQVEDSTYWSYSFTLNTLKNHFKCQPIDEIKQLDINRFIDTLLERELSKSTISKCKSMLVQIFTAAKDNELIQKNPALRAKSAKSAKRHVHPKNAFTLATIYWAALSLYTVNSQNITFQWLAQVIVGEIFHVQFPGMEYDPDVYPISRAVSFSFIDEYISGYIEGQLTEIYDIAKAHGHTQEEIMDALDIPNAIRNIYRKALSIYGTSSEDITFRTLADNIFNGLNAMNRAL